jgi:beta-alanine degradation protein BauB
MGGIDGELNDQLAASVLFENDRVRVWEDHAEPGRTKPLHVHRRPYITIIIIAGERAENIGEDGSVLQRFDGLKPGQAHYVGPDKLPLVHALHNTGSTSVSIIIVELLG